MCLLALHKHSRRSHTVLCMSEIDLDGPEPLYEQVARIIRERIEDGTYEINRRIPGEYPLSEEFGVSRPTIWKALQVIKDEGLARGVAGRGTFVVKKPDESPAQES